MCEQGQVEVYVCVNNTWKDVNTANNKGACAVDYDESTGTHRLFIKPKYFQQYSILHELVHIFDRDRSGARPISESHEMQQAMDQLEAESGDNVVVQVREYVHQGHYRPQLFKSETAAYAAGSPFSERNSHVRNYVLAKMEERAQQILNQADTGYGGRY